METVKLKERKEEYDIRHNLSENNWIIGSVSSYLPVEYTRSFKGKIFKVSKALYIFCILREINSLFVSFL
jgi:hypothetical protein